MNLKSEIAPKGLQFKPKEFIISGKNATLLTVISYPKYINPGLKMRYQSENDQTIQERIRQDYESLENFISMLAASQARIFDFQLHIMITANNPEELEMRKMQVNSYIDAMGMRGFVLRFEQRKIRSAGGTG